MPFYIVFVLLAVYPAQKLAEVLSAVLSKLDMEFIKQLATWGVLEAPTTVVIIGFLVWLYLNHLWKLPLLNKIHGVPNVNGRYKGKIFSSYNGQETEYECFLELKQTLTNLSVSLFTSRSSSYSLIANMIKNEHENWGLAYIYSNTPKTTQQSDSDMRCHQGFATFDIFGKKLEGNYFNHSRERQTYGLIKVTFEQRKTKGHFRI